MRGLGKGGKGHKKRIRPFRATFPSKRNESRAS